MDDDDQGLEEENAYLNTQQYSMQKLTPQMQLEDTSIKKNESVDTGLFEVDDTLPKFGYPKVLPALGKVVVEMASK